MRSHSRQGATIPRSDGYKREKTCKSATSDESAQQAMGNTKLIEALEEARDNKMELTGGESVEDKLQRKIRSTRRQRENKMDTEGKSHRQSVTLNWSV